MCKLKLFGVVIRTLFWVYWMAEMIWTKRMGNLSQRPSMRLTVAGKAATRSLTHKTSLFM